MAGWHFVLRRSMHHGRCRVRFPDKQRFVLRLHGTFSLVIRQRQGLVNYEIQPKSRFMTKTKRNKKKKHKKRFAFSRGIQVLRCLGTLVFGQFLRIFFEMDCPLNNVEFNFVFWSKGFQFEETKWASVSLLFRISLKQISLKSILNPLNLQFYAWKREAV